MNKFLSYALVFIVSAIGLVTALSNYNQTAASKAYAQGQARAMVITATSQAQQATASNMFPYFVLGLGFLGILLILTVIVVLNNRKEDRLDRQLQIMANQSVVERHYLHTKETVLIAPQHNRREFYQSLGAPVKQPVKVLSSKSN